MQPSCVAGIDHGLVRLSIEGLSHEEQCIPEAQLLHHSHSLPERGREIDSSSQPFLEYAQGAYREELAQIVTPCNNELASRSEVLFDFAKGLPPRVVRTEYPPLSVL